MIRPDAALEAELADRYRIERAIGAGGMATVFLADDLRHHRKVAIKVLRPELAAVVGRDRFLQEIEVTANLQHPNILSLIDSGSANGQLYYVMPFVAGESLRARLERERQLPVDDTVAIATAVAAALDYAHRRGVVHRDIKPENILLHDGHVLVADFGISRAVTHAGGDRLTETGMSLGTPRYMSPEQASGESHVDGRSDVYALGCAVYEMLAGAPPFDGPTAQATLAAVLTGDAPPLQRLRPAVSDDLAAAVHTALEKIPADRFGTAGEFAQALGESATRSGPRAIRRNRRRRFVRPVATHVAVATLALAAGLAIGRVGAGSRGGRPGDPRHWNLVLPENAAVALTGPGPLGIWQLAVALAPDGDKVVYVAPRGGTTALAVRPLDSDSAVVLAGTEGAYHPFVSADGQSIGHFVGNELRRISASGGSAVTLTTVDRPAGAAWPVPGTILVFEQDGFLLRWVSASGGGQDSTVLLEAQFGAPEVLPGGRWAVGHLSSGQLALLSLADGALRAITRRGVLPLDSVRLDDLLIGASPKYVSSGHLVFGTEDGLLMALPFDPDARGIRGGPVPILTGVRIEEGFGFAQFDVAPDGTLIYVPGRSQLYGHVASLRPDGRYDTLPLPRGQYTQPRLSPDGTRLAVQARKPVGGWEVLIVDLETGVRQRVEVPGNYRAYPASWTPDGQALLVGLFRPVRNVFLGARLYSFTSHEWEDLPPLDGSYLTIAPNGREFAYSNWRTGDLFIRPLRGDTTPVRIPARGFAASFSPDGRWLAWGGADGSVAVSPVPPTGAIYQVAERGQQPLWMPDGRRLVYRDGRRFFEVPIETSAGLRPGRRRLLAEGPFIRTFAWNHTVGPDGRLAVLVSMPGDEARQLGVITGFDLELRRRVPPDPRP